MLVRFSTPEIDISTPPLEMEQEIALYAQLIKESKGSLEGYIDLLLDVIPNPDVDGYIDSAIDQTFQNLDPVEQLILLELS